MIRWPFLTSSPVVSYPVRLASPCLQRCIANGFCRRPGEFVDTLVFCMSIVTTYPVPLGLMADQGSIQTLPEISILDRIAAGRSPALGNPAWHPLLHALHHVLRISRQRDRAMLAQRLRGH